MTDEFEISDEIYQEILKGADKVGYHNQTDRILINAMVALVKSGHATFFVLAK